MTSAAPYIELPDAPPRVEACWQTTVLASGDYTVLPDGRMDLVVRFDASPEGALSKPALAIIGPSSLPATIPVREGQIYLGIRFKPGYGACLGMLPTRVADRALHGQEALATLPDLASAVLDAEQLTFARRAMHELALRLASRDVRVAPAAIAAIDRVHGSGGRTSVASLAHELRIPERSLRRQMHDAIGLTPKLFASVMRFQRTMRLLEFGEQGYLAEIAIEGGYSDQAHMTRDFRRHGGFTPGGRLPSTLVTIPLAD
jgi:AraC-like DNA-binding protein